MESLSDAAYKKWRKSFNREKGYVYTVDKTGNIWAIPMKHNPSGHKHIVGEKGTPAFVKKYNESFERGN